MLSSWLAASSKQSKQLVAGSLTLRETLALTGYVFSMSQALASVEGHAPAHKAQKELLEPASQQADPKLVARAVGA